MSLWQGFKDEARNFNSITVNVDFTTVPKFCPYDLLPLKHLPYLSLMKSNYSFVNAFTDKSYLDGVFLCGRQLNLV